MATAIKGSVSLTYGAHTQSETFSTTASTLTNANEHHNYAAGGGRALVAGGALDVGTIGAAEGLLIIKNDNNYGALEISLEDASNYDISIPAGIANLISVGGSGAVYVKCPTATESGITVATVTSAGVITFGSGGAIGTAIMTGVSNVNGNTNDYLVEFSAAGVGTVYELDGVTIKDLTADYDLANNSTVNLVYIVKYRYTLTEA
ncbi:MAG: hypothetical protein CL959_04765 [Euryarchaeota archaeon]|nr:hypothetical protein [Euryarchaeota archaeon]|tara:strand:- start:856 stop:1470 length:615 start_codon:yes stop_codon:yes gene_type:complete